jgi:hypothetical protein
MLLVPVRVLFPEKVLLALVIATVPDCGKVTVKPETVNDELVMLKLVTVVLKREDTPVTNSDPVIVSCCAVVSEVGSDNSVPAALP